MTASEFVFLAMGLVLGVAAGAAIVEVLRARPPAPREVRVTVSQDAIPRRRPATLSDDAFTAPAAEPARGGPADRRQHDVSSAPSGGERRTPVQNGAVVATAPTAIAVSAGIDPSLVAMRASAARSAEAAMAPANDAATARATATTTATASAVTGVAVLDRPDDVVAMGQDPRFATPPAGVGAADAAPSGPCADLRRVADERCELATRARAQSVAVDEALRAAQREYDEHEARADAAAAVADPRAVRTAKDEAQARFRRERASGGDAAYLEEAARAWLAEINRINGEAREASAMLTREREAARMLALALERAVIEADAARIAAATAESACLSAREAAADCDERELAGVAAAAAIPPATNAAAAAAEPIAVSSIGDGGTPRIFRLLRGDRAAMHEFVTALANDDDADRRRWQLAVSDLVDAILADAIEDTALAFPETHAFWGPFTQSQDRDIAAALASLGYRFDGLGGWVDGRTPSQRDLSLAVGYAGLDPMRIRHWPTETEMAELYRDVSVSADEHLAGNAPDLTLGELVTMLDRRADPLADLWNEWGRVRPLLLEER